MLQLGHNKCVRFCTPFESKRVLVINKQCTLMKHKNNSRWKYTTHALGQHNTKKR